MLRNRVPTLLVLFALLAALCPGCAKNNVQDAAPGPATSVSAKHILVQYEGSMRASPDIARTKVEAKARIDECLEKARQGAKFEDLALEFEDLLLILAAKEFSQRVVDQGPARPYACSLHTPPDDLIIQQWLFAPSFSPLP